jgi:hypothetical protein
VRKKPGFRQRNRKMSDNTELDAVDVEYMESVEVLTADAELAAKRDPTGWIIEWFMRKEVELDAAKEAIEKHVKLLLNQIEAQRKGLHWKWGLMFRQEAEARLKAERKSKSFLTPFGRVGHRSQGGKPTLVVEDEEAAIAEAEIVAPDAVKRSLLKTPLLEYAQQHERPIAGTRIETPEKHDVFYAGSHTFGEPNFENPNPLLLEGNDDARRND